MFVSLLRVFGSVNCNGTFDSSDQSEKSISQYLNARKHFPGRLLMDVSVYEPYMKSSH